MASASPPAAAAGGYASAWRPGPTCRSGSPPSAPEPPPPRCAADGWYPALVPRDRIDTLRSSAATADGDPTLIAGPMIAAGNNARRSAEQLIGWYLTGMGPLYAEFVASLGYRGEVSALRAANPRPAPGAIEWPREADPLLDQLAAIGDRHAIAGQLARVGRTRRHRRRVRRPGHSRRRARRRRNRRPTHTGRRRLLTMTPNWARGGERRGRTDRPRVRARRAPR